MINSPNTPIVAGGQGRKYPFGIVNIFDGTELHPTTNCDNNLTSSKHLTNGQTPSKTTPYDLSTLPNDDAFMLNNVKKQSNGKYCSMICAAFLFVTSLGLLSAKNVDKLTGKLPELILW